MVYVPNWFSVDLKTGVSVNTAGSWLSHSWLPGCMPPCHCVCACVFWIPVCQCGVLSFNRCSPSRWTRVTASLPGCLQRMLGFQALMDPTQNVRHWILTLSLLHCLSLHRISTRTHTHTHTHTLAHTLQPVVLHVSESERVSGDWPSDRLTHLTVG